MKSAALLSLSVQPLPARARQWYLKAQVLDPILRSNSYRYQTLRNRQPQQSDMSLSGRL